jgi:plasmid stabilization system protein ParE
MKKVVFAPRAREEFEAAVEWYDSQQSGLGSEFVTLVDEVVRLVQEQPLAFAVWDRDIRFRHVVTGRFPYVVFYRVLDDTIEVTALAHGAREPGYWLRRQ